MLRILFVFPSQHTLLSSSALPLESVEDVESAPPRTGPLSWAAPLQKLPVSLPAWSAWRRSNLRQLCSPEPFSNRLKPPKAPGCELLILKYKLSISESFRSHWPGSSTNSLVAGSETKFTSSISSASRQSYCLCA